MNINYAQVNSVSAVMSILICLLLMSQQLIQRHSRQKNFWFIVIIFGNTLMLCGDLAEWGLENKPGKTVHILMSIFAVYVYYIAAGIMMYAAIRWILSMVEETHEVNKRWYIVTLIPFVLQILISLTMSVHKAAYISEDNVYHRGDSFFLAMICVYILYAIAYSVLIRFRRYIKTGQRITLWAFFMAPFFGQLFQVLNPNYTLQNVLISLLLIYIYAFVQSRRDVEHEEEMRKVLERENEKLHEVQHFQEIFSTQLIDVLSRVLEEKDIYTKGHSLRVALYSKEIMRRMGGDETKQQEVFYIGILHDIGKLSIDDSIINKKGRLSDEEFEQIKLHTVAGFQFLRNVKVIPDLAVGARWHHERYDGKGYPNGIAGENIPEIARIISVADAYDAMTSNRSYVNARPQSYARDEIAKGIGTQFDPEIARIMLEMIDEDIEYNLRQKELSVSRKILIIDDDEFEARSIKEICSAENRMFESVRTGKEGLQAIEDWNYDLIIVNAKMPDMSGFEFLERVKKKKIEIPSIYLANDKSIGTFRKADGHGVIDTITKPINPWVVKKIVNSYFNQR